MTIETMLLHSSLSQIVPIWGELAATELSTTIYKETLLQLYTDFSQGGREILSAGTRAILFYSQVIKIAQEKYLFTLES